MIRRPKRLGRRLMIRLSDRMYDGLRALAAEKECDVSQLIRDAVDGAYFLAPSVGKSNGLVSTELHEVAV